MKNIEYDWYERYCGGRYCGSVSQGEGERVYILTIDSGAFQIGILCWNTSIGNASSSARATRSSTSPSTTVRMSFFTSLLPPSPPCSCPLTLLSTTPSYDTILPRHITFSRLYLSFTNLCFSTNPSTFLFFLLQIRFPSSRQSSSDTWQAHPFQMNILTLLSPSLFLESLSPVSLLRLSYSLSYYLCFSDISRHVMEGVTKFLQFPPTEAYRYYLSSKLHSHKQYSYSR